jgi:hypothetical protein
MESRLPDGLERLRDSYGELWVVRGLAQQVPYIGPLLDSLLAGDASALVERRLSEFLELLREEMYRILKDQYDEGFLKSQDYAHLVVLVFHASARTREREKQRLYARLLTRAGTREWSARPDRTEELLRMLTDLSLGDIEVLNAVNQQHSENSESEVTAATVQSALPHLARDEVEGYLARLARTGFIYGHAGGWYDSVGENEYQRTSFLTELMSLLRAPEAI